LIFFLNGANNGIDFSFFLVSLTSCDSDKATVANMLEETTNYFFSSSFSSIQKILIN